MQITKPDTKESLFSIGESFYALESLLIESEGEIDGVIDRWLQEYEAKEQDKVDAYCYLIQKFEEISAESSRLAKRSKAYKNKSSQLKGRLMNYLDWRGKRLIETDRFTVKISGNGGVQPIQIREGVTPEQLPERFVRITTEIHREALRDALLDGDPEASQFADLLPRGQHLTIK